MSPDFWILASAFSILLVHSIVPVIRGFGGRAEFVLNAVSAGFGLTHWLLFNADATYQYADSLRTKFLHNIPAEFLLYMLLSTVMVGMLFMYGLDTMRRFFQKNKTSVPDSLYRIQLILLFLFNYSPCHAIPAVAYKETAEVFIYTLDCVIAFSLADYTLSKNFHGKYNFYGRLFAICGVMTGILTGYVSLHQEHDWHMAFLDSFLMGVEMIMIMFIEFSPKETTSHYWIFFFSVIFMAVLLGSFYYVNWNTLL